MKNLELVQVLYRLCDLICQSSSGKDAGLFSFLCTRRREFKQPRKGEILRRKRDAGEAVDLPQEERKLVQDIRNPFNPAFERSETEA